MSENIALNKAYGGSGYVNGFPYSNAFDGNINHVDTTNWFAPLGDLTAFIYVNLGNSYFINSVKLNQTGTGTGLLYRCKDFTIRGSNDGEVWEDLGNYTLLNILGLQSFVVASNKKYRFLGIYIKNHYGTDYHSYPIGLNEIEVYGVKINNKYLMKSQNKINTLSEDKTTLIYPNIQEPLNQENYETWGMNSLSGYENQIDKVSIEMKNEGILEDGFLFRKTINKNDFKVNRLKVGEIGG
ncbi:discoidin domain-containing protein [Tissierella sp.]|uniref:discoidin domain-containing protein n=1 Tax=Tissierella sp. TaxID=41274 RepID=UPI0030406E62